MTKAANIQSIEKGTGISWDEWLKHFESIDARKMTHKEISVEAYGFIMAAPGDETTKLNAAGWWAQSVAVAYEQHIGRRLPGQRSDGSFEVTISKTLDGSMKEAFKWWIGKAGDVTEFLGIKISGKPDISKTDKWYYWRVNLADGTRIGVSVTDKSPGKALFAVTNYKLKSPEEAEKWRSYWKKFING